METRSRAKRRKMLELTTASFDVLPEEIILQIFTNLEFYDNASASQVCKRWKLLCEDQSLWLKINLNNRKVPVKFIEKALRHGCHYLGLCRAGGIKGVASLYSGTPSFSIKNQLKYLSISYGSSYPYDELMKNLLGATQSLEKLSIQCDPQDNMFNFQPNIIQNSQSLTVLRIASFKRLTLETVKLIFNNCLELVEVSLHDCGMSDGALSFLCNNLTNKIKKLSLYRISAFGHFGLYDYILEEKHVITLANRYPQLEELDLGGQENVISEEALSAIIEKLQNLVKLKLPDTVQIRFHKLLELRSMTNLKYLWVHVVLEDGDVDIAIAYERHLWHEKFEELRRETPFMKALVKNLPNLKINEGRFEIATPNPSFLSKDDSLWEKQCKPTGDFVGF